MKRYQQKELLPYEQAFKPHSHVQLPDLMIGNAFAHEVSEPVTLQLRVDARQLVRLVQCPRCSQPFDAPVTLPCGHTLCRQCLPAPSPRLHVSYPNSPDRLMGITCPLALCKQEHAAAECNVDVTFSKVMDLIKTEVDRFAQQDEDSPMLVSELLRQDKESQNADNEAEPNIGHSRILHGGRMVSTFLMVKLGELRYSSDARYEPLSPLGDKYDQLDAAFLGRLREVTSKELDCLVCYNIMLDPTTTCCGHTFCRRCLARVMDHSSLCPICRRGLHFPASLQNKAVNALLSSLSHGLCPDLVADRQRTLELEEKSGDEIYTTPLFLCTLSLPNMPTFLHVFEPRYRLMMRRCFEGNKQFGMVMYNNFSVPQGEMGSTPFLEYGTLLEIVNYELLRDGRSFIETRGIGRFQIRGHGMLDGYHVASVVRVEDVSLADEASMERSDRVATQHARDAFLLEHPGHDASTLPTSLGSRSTQELLDTCMAFIHAMREASAPWLSARIVHVYGEPPSDPALFPYWFASVVPIAEEEKYILLQTTTVRERLKIVAGWVERIRGSQWRSGSACCIL